MYSPPPPDLPPSVPPIAPADAQAPVEADVADLRRQVEELRHKLHAKDAFLASLSHEFRTPLGAVLGLTEALRHGTFGPVPDLQMAQLGTIEDSGRHVLSLINDLLDLTRISLGRLPLQPGPVDLAGVCDVAVRLVRPVAERCGVRVDLQILDRIGLIVGDGVRLKQVFLNLLSNAVRFSPQGGTVGIEVRRFDGIHVEVAVWDQGPGIAAEDRALVFQPYVQIGGAGQRNHAGFGLGLALVHSLVDLHGGQVRLDTAPGGGARFVVRLPTGKVEPLPADFGLPWDEPPQRPSIRAKRVVVVDDNDINREMVAMFLISKGFRVEQADSGLRGIELIERLLPDVVLMDIQMPGMDGIEAIRRLRAREFTAHTPIIAVTALAMASDRARCLAAGADHYLSKPVRLGELARMVAEVTGLQGQERAGAC
jgi:CheY-like chemotaxis protein